MFRNESAENYAFRVLQRLEPENRTRVAARSRWTNRLLALLSDGFLVVNGWGHYWGSLPADVPTS